MRHHGTLLALPLVAAALVIACGSEGHSQFSDGNDAGAGDDAAHGPGPGFSGGDDASTTTTTADDPTTCAEAATTKSYVGCDYWPTVTVNAVWSVFDFAVVASNTGKVPADVTVTGPNGFTKHVTIAPQSLATITLPWVADLKGPDSNACAELAVMDHSVVAPASAYHLVSSRPIVVYQFNALEYRGQGGQDVDGGTKDWSSCPGLQTCAMHGGPWGCYSFSNDASLLLPSTAMTGNYRVIGMHGWSESGTDVMGSFVAITATSDATHVTMDLAPNARVVAGGSIAASSGGGTMQLTLNAGDVAEVVSEKGNASDFSGSLVRADKAVQVIAGNPCIYLPQGTAYCDHLESSVFPVETLGKHYLVTVPTSPKGDVVGHVVRIYGNVDGTNLTYSPTRPATCPATVNAGQVVDCGVLNTSFEVTGDHEFGVATYMLGGAKVDPTNNLQSKGDPSQSLFAGVEQFRTKYLFLAPADYDVSYADITGPSDAQPMLDGAPISATFEPVGGAGFGVWRTKLVGLAGSSAGVHTLTAQKPIGVQVIGYGMYTSYQYPGGLNLRRIAPPPPPPK